MELLEQCLRQAIFFPKQLARKVEYLAKSLSEVFWIVCGKSLAVCGSQVTGGKDISPGEEVRD